MGNKDAVSFEEENVSVRNKLHGMVIAAMLRQSGEVEASAEVMADMNELIKAPELTTAVQKMAKQLQKVKIVSLLTCRNI